MGQSQTIKLQRGFGESHGLTTPGRSVSWHLKYSSSFFNLLNSRGWKQGSL